jgi:hypothetical protein
VSVTCHQDDEWWLDSCGNTEVLKNQCGFGCENGECRLPLDVVRVTNLSSQTPDLAENETTVSINPLDLDHLAVASQHFHVDDPARRWLTAYVSFDAGQTWSRRAVPSTTTVEGETSYGGDPTIVFAGSSLFFASMQALSGEDLFNRWVNGLFLVRSDDGGLTFQADEAVGSGFGAGVGEPTFYDKAWLTTDETVPPMNRSLVVSYLHTDPVSGLSITQLRKRAPGESFSGPVTVSSVPGWGTIPVVAPDGSIHVVWQADSEAVGDHRIMHASTEDGTSFVSNTVGNYEVPPTGALGGGLEFLNLPSFDIDRSQGPNQNKLYVVYNTHVGSRDVIVLTTSADSGGTWAIPTPVSPQEGGDQFLPCVAVDPNDGRVYVAYFDGRIRPDNSAVDLYVAVSDDGGGTFGEVRITPSPFDATEGSVHGYFVGDYNMIRAREGRVVVAYPDNRDGTYDLWVAVLSRNQRSPE